MTDLVLLNFENGEIVRCASLEASRKAAISRGDHSGRIVAEITPEGGGVMTTLEFDRSLNDWVPV